MIRTPQLNRSDKTGNPNSDQLIWFLAPTVSFLALGVVSFLYMVVLVNLIGFTAKLHDVALFLVGVALLPLVSSVIQAFLIRPNFARPAGAIESLNHWAAILALTALPSAALILHFAGGDISSWRVWAKRIVEIIVLGHAVGVIAVIASRHAAVTHLHCFHLGSRRVQILLVVASFILSVFGLFWVDPSHLPFEPISQLFLQYVPGEQRWFGIAGAIAFGLISAGAVFAALFVEQHLLSREQHYLEFCRLLALIATIIITIITYFDFAMPTDAVHYMLNVSPALHIWQGGGTLLVDTFSIYGPGPILATLIGFLLGPATFGTANIVVQVANIGFYVVWLVCVYRLNSYKLPALILGYFSIAFLLAEHAFWAGSINEVPSVMGFRYWPSILMVLAISFLKPFHRYSSFTAICTFLAALWSIETLAVTLLLHLGTIVFINLKPFALRRLCSDIVVASIPAVLAIVALSIAALINAGEMPDFVAYLDFLKGYNHFNYLWARDAPASFFGWIPLMVAAFLVLGAAWMNVLRPSSQFLHADAYYITYRLTPMGFLTILTGFYFVGRSIPIALAQATLPFLALLIPALLALSRMGLAMLGALSADGRLSLVRRIAGAFLLLLPGSIMAGGIAFSVVLLDRTDTHYSLLFHECLNEGRCSPHSLVEGVKARLAGRPVLERVGNPAGDLYTDKHGVVRDAVDALHQWAETEPKVTVLLGPADRKGWPIASELALMYTGKWHTWPISLMMTDVESPRIVARILAAPVKLKEGELVIVRRDEKVLDSLQSAILAKIRDTHILCPLGEARYKHIVVFRVGGPAGCPERTRPHLD